VAQTPVFGLILDRLPASIELALTAMVIALGLGISLGVVASLKPRSLISRCIMAGSLFGISIPTFLTGLLLILLFAVTFRVLPPFGRGQVIKVVGEWETGFLTLDGIRHLLLPAFTLGMWQLGLLVRLTQGEMLEVLREDYVRTAWAKGLPQRTVIFKHALRNALIPVVTIAGLRMGQLIGFSIVTESVFQWPGSGNLLLTSIYEADFPVIAAYMILMSIIIQILNLSVDILYVVLNPKIAYD